MATCPVCGLSVPRSRLEFHVNICLDRNSAPSTPVSTGGPILSPTGRPDLSRVFSLPPPAPEVRSLLPELRLLRLQNAAISSSSPPQGGLLYFKLNSIEKRTGVPPQTLEPFPPSFSTKISLDGHSHTSPAIASKRLPSSKSLVADFSFDGVIEIHEYLSSAQISIEVSEQNTLAIGYDAKVLGTAKIRLSEALSLHAQAALTESERRKTWKNIIPMGGLRQTTSYSPLSSLSSSPVLSSTKKKKRWLENEKDSDRSSSSNPLSILSHSTTRSNISFSTLPLSSHSSSPVLLPSPHGRFTSFDNPSLCVKIMPFTDPLPLTVSFSDQPNGGWLGMTSHKLVICVPHKKIEHERRERIPRERSFWQRLTGCFIGTVADDAIPNADSDMITGVEEEEERTRVRRQSIRNVLAGVTTALQFNSKSSTASAVASEADSLKWGDVDKSKLKNRATAPIPRLPPPPPPPQDIVEVSIQFIYIPKADILRVPGSLPHITPAHRAAIDGNAVLLKALASSKREVLLQRTTPADCSDAVREDSFSLSHLSVLDVAILARQQHIVSLLCAALLPSPRLGGEALGLHALHIAALAGDTSILQAVVSSITQGAAEADKADIVANSVRARLGNVNESTRDQILHSPSSAVRGLGLGAGGILQPRQSDAEDVENLVAAWTASSKRFSEKAGASTSSEGASSRHFISDQLENFLEPIYLANSSIPEVPASALYSSFSNATPSTSSSSSSAATVFEKARQLKVLSMKRFENGTESGILDLASGIDGITPLGLCALRGDAEGALVLIRAGSHVGLTDSRHHRTILMMALRGASLNATRVATIILLRNESPLPISSFQAQASSSAVGVDKTQHPSLGCCRGVIVNHSSSNQVLSDANVQRTSFLSTKLSLSLGTDFEGGGQVEVDNKSFLTGKQLREKIAQSRPAAVSNLGETALLLATINACRISCECHNSEKMITTGGLHASSSSFSSLAVVRLLIEAGCPRNVPCLIPLKSNNEKEPYVSGTTALHVAARNLNLCAVRLLTLSDSSSVFSSLMSLQDRRDADSLNSSPHKSVWDIPSFENEDEIVAFCDAVAKNDARDWRGSNLPKGIDLPVSILGASQEVEQAYCEALCEALSIIRAVVPQDPLSSNSSMGDDGRGGGRKINRYSHRTFTMVRDSSGYTPLGLAARTIAADHSRSSSIIVLKLLFKIRTLELWAIEQGFVRETYKDIDKEEEEEEENEVEIDLL